VLLSESSVAAYAWFRSIVQPIPRLESVSWSMRSGLSDLDRVAARFAEARRSSRAAKYGFSGRQRDKDAASGQLHGLQDDSVCWPFAFDRRMH
jgi:hypothetical protein